MDLKSLLLTLFAISALPGYAADYYVTPEGAGARDGSSWDNAFGVEEFRTQAAANANGDTYHLAAGVYKPSETIIFKTATGATLIGNADGERTVFSGDKNGNNNPDEGDANRLIRFQANTVNGNSANRIVISDIDFTCVYTNTNTDSDSMGALMIDNSGDVEVNNCRFYGNWSQGNQGGPAAHLYRSTVSFKGCTFNDNNANYRGGAVRLRSNDANKGITTFYDCTFKYNTNYHNIGGAILLAHGKELNIINSTLYGNKAASDGAAIYANGKGTYACRVNIVNSTIAANVITGTAGDGQVTSTQTANIAIANSVIASGDPDTTADFYFKGAAEDPNFSFLSGGYNYCGTILDGAAEAAKTIAWADTDTHGGDCTYTAIFADNTLDADNVVKPAYFHAGATGAQVTEATAAWALPAGLDLTVDRLGNTRTSDMTPGAYAASKADITTGIGDIHTDTDAASLTALGSHRYVISGTITPAAVYDICGHNVLNAAPSATIDLSHMAAGVYIIKAGNTIFKVKK